MKTMKRILAVVLVVVLVLVSLAVFLPTLLSTNAGRGLILRMANKGSDQKLDIGVLSLAWRGSQQVEQVSVSDPKGRQVVSVAKVSLAKGLLDLLRNSADIGLIEIVEPTVSLYPPPPLPEGAPPPKERPPRKPAERPAPRKPEKPAEPARLPSLHGEIRISGGSVLAPAAGEQVQALLKDLNVTIKLDGLDKPLEYTATLAAADDRGQLSSRGTITLPTDGVLRPTQIGADAELAVTDWDLASLAALAAAGGAPAVKGTLNLRGSLAGNLRDGLQI
ncbi:MAG: hypothetical protein JXB04_02775, partial [Kiritimatiellae bacterium]|nr:hypothetical protein [Kiritimatiellia bacterium]